MDEELFLIDWIKDKDTSSFWESTEKGLTGMVIMNTPIKSKLRSR